MPKQKPGRSRQDYGTPIALIQAVEARFKVKMGIDLAAHEENKKAPFAITPAMDSLKFSWACIRKAGGSGWLNPPFERIAPWADKCAAVSEAFPKIKIFFLTPASIGANWFEESVHGRALVLALKPRLTFEGCTDPYPKDCILSCYGMKPGFEIWRWK